MKIIYFIYFTIILIQFSYFAKFKRYLSIKFNKYLPVLNELGLIKPNKLKRSLSAPSLNITSTSSNTDPAKWTQNVNLDDGQLKKLLARLVNESGINNNANSTAKMSEQVQPNEPVFGFFNDKLKAKLNELNNAIKEKQELAKDYNQRLFYIYCGFRRLKANPKYLKQIFGDSLAENFKVEQPNGPDDAENLVLNIFSG